MDTNPVPDPAPPAGLLSRIYSWGTTNWRSSMGVIGIAAEAAAQLQAHGHVGPAWLVYGHVVFFLFCSAGYISAGDAKKVADLETALAARMASLHGASPAAHAPPPAPPGRS